MYSEKVMEHFSNPRNIGEVENADGMGEVGNPTCGDLMKVTIRVEDDRLVVKSEFSINRFDFMIEYKGRADDLIRNEVVIELEMTATPANAS